MSRKTKQEKIIAELRRRLEVTKREKGEARNEILENEVRSEERETEKSNLSFPSPASSFTPPTSYCEATSSAYIKKDLTRTGILTMLAISLELVVYWIWR